MLFQEFASQIYLVVPANALVFFVDFVRFLLVYEIFKGLSGINLPQKSTFWVTFWW